MTAARITTTAALGAALLLGATSCAPTYVLGVRPARGTGQFAAGHEQATATADSVEVRLNFVAYEPERLVFNVEYRNPTSRPLLVDPAAFRYRPGRQPGPPLPPAQPRPKPARGQEVTAGVAAASQARPLPALPAGALPAFDPEPEIAALQARADKEAAKASRFDWLGLALTVTSIAADVASVGRRDTPAQAQSRAALHDAAVTYNVVSAANKVEHAVAAEVLAGQAHTLQDFALRKVTLAPGQQVRGYLYFPRFDTADGLQVQVPVGGQVLPVEFVQSRVRE